MVQNATSGKVDLTSNGLIKWESLTNNKWEVNFSSGIDFTDETWHHYVLTSGVNDTKLYVDGLIS